MKQRLKTSNIFRKDRVSAAELAHEMSRIRCCRGKRNCLRNGSFRFQSSIFRLIAAAYFPLYFLCTLLLLPRFCFRLSMLFFFGRIFTHAQFDIFVPISIPRRVNTACIKCEHEVMKGGLSWFRGNNSGGLRRLTVSCPTSCYFECIKLTDRHG